MRIQGGQSGENFSYPQVKYLAEQNEMFMDLCGYNNDTFNVGPPETLEPTGGAWVSGSYYQTLGLCRPWADCSAPMMTGREQRLRQSLPTTLGTKVRARPNAVGRTLLVEGVPVTIVGVSPTGFSGAIVGKAADITVALSALPQLKPERGFMLGVGGRWLKVLARPRPGLSQDQLKARLAVVWPQY